MSEESHPPAHDWVDQAFQSAPNVEPKYRDLLAMLAAALMGNAGAAQHFYNQAIADGASDAELQRMADIARAQNVEMGDLAANVKRAADEIRAEQEPSDNAEESDDKLVSD